MGGGNQEAKDQKVLGGGDSLGYTQRGLVMMLLGGDLWRSPGR